MLKQPRSIVFAVAAQGEYLLLIRSALAALANVLCLGGEPGPLPRLGICALEVAAKTGKVQLRVKLRPSLLNLIDFHISASKIMPSQPGLDPIAGHQAALALQSLSQVILQDKITKGSNTTIVLITDHLMSAADFHTYLTMEAGKKVHLQIMFLCEAGSAAETAAAAYDWKEAEAAHPDLTVTIIEIGGRVAVQTVARALLATCTDNGLASIPVALQFSHPFLGNLRTLYLEAHSEIRPLDLSLSHCIVCACHSSPLALCSPPTSNSGGGGGATTLPIDRQRTWFQCPITGARLAPSECIHDGKTLCVGNTTSGVLTYTTPVSLTGPSFAVSSVSGGVNNTHVVVNGASGSTTGGGNLNLNISGALLRVKSKVNIASTNSALIIGPSITLKPISNVSTDAAGSTRAAGIKVPVNGEMVAVSQEQLLNLVTADLRAKNQALMVETTWDLHRGVNGLFTFHYMLVPAQNSHGSVFCAVRIASIEELAPSAVPAVLHDKEKEAPPPAAVVAAIKAVLAKVPEEPDKGLPYSSKVHETIDMLVESHDGTPEPAAAAVTGEGSRDAAGGQEAAPAPAPVAAGGGSGRGTSLGKRGAGNSTAPSEVTEGKAGRGGRGRGTGSAGAAGRRRRQFAVVQPVADHTKLELSNEGLSVLRNIKGKVAPIVVIGPYRSGKSFTLNQLLGVGCDEGFGVGHTRNTQTKGVWVWGEPIPVQSPDGETINILLFDTEGFESTGKADSYDDRIFALSTLISSVLIYNLPESIRESDVEKLSFAAELAKAFYTTSTNNDSENNIDENGSVVQQDAPIRPGSMVWLIQRDFLQGASLKKTLETALKQVPNPHNDPAITQLNRIRQGLAAITGNSTALGLPQPHLDRTRLCEIPDEQLDPGYLQKREELKSTVMTSAVPKVVKGQALDGPALAELISQVVTALNDRDIPTAGSLVEYFNRELVDACRDQFVKSLEKIAIPVEEATLETVAETARKAATKKFEKERFGSAVASLREILDTALQRELTARKTSNTYESSRVCEAAELECETALERESAQKLPSTGRFEARYQKCKTTFDQHCVGPAKEHNEERLQKAWERESSRFNRDYNERLYNGLVLMSVAAIVIFRFVVRWSLGETAGWAAFLFLQLYPKSFLGTGSSMYDTTTWQSLISVWEMVIDNPLIDLERWGTVSLVVIVVLILTRRRWAGKCRTCCGRRRGGRGRSKTLANRDLDV